MRKKPLVKEKKTRTKNRYMRHSKLSEYRFLKVLRGFAFGYSPKTIAAETGISEKTIRAANAELRLKVMEVAKTGKPVFGLGSRYLYENGRLTEKGEIFLQSVSKSKIFESYMAIHAPRLKEDDARDIYVFDLGMRVFAGLVLAEDEFYALSPGLQRSLGLLDAMQSWINADKKTPGFAEKNWETLERYDHLRRKGVGDPRADVGLAFLRAFTPGSLPRNKLNSDHILEMAENILQHMLNEPMDEDGNTKSYLHSEPGWIHHNNNGVFDRKYWATHGASIEAWKKKQKRKKEKRRLGYVRTFVHEQTLQEQRDALAKVECCKIFEVIDMSANDERWPGLDALLAEAFEYDTVVILSLDRFGPYDERWAEVMRTLYERRADLCAINENLDSSGRILKCNDATLRKT